MEQRWESLSRITDLLRFIWSSKDETRKIELLQRLRVP